MNPVSWTQKRGFCMAKLTYEDKINLYMEKNLAIEKSYDMK